MCRSEGARQRQNRPVQSCISLVLEASEFTRLNDLVGIKRKHSSFLIFFKFSVFFLRLRLLPSSTVFGFSIISRRRQYFFVTSYHLLLFFFYIIYFFSFPFFSILSILFLYTLVISVFSLFFSSETQKVLFRSRSSTSIKTSQGLWKCHKSRYLF